jgi:hypothetical protein
MVCSFVYDLSRIMGGLAVAAALVLWIGVLWALGRSLDRRFPFHDRRRRD